jgi:aryl-alcohol dehydrogenase-like predicted oxidoreductase
MKLVLGTAQFGLNYGVTNQNGRVAIEEVKNILRYAQANGIDTLDTASRYGVSEQVLGKVGVDNFKIVTKTASLKNGVNNVLKGFYQSLESLNTKAIDGLLIHDIDELNSKDFNDLYKKIYALKLQGLVNKIGFSTYTPEQVDFLSENFDFDIIQLPFNVLDNRLTQGGQLKVLKNNGVEIHARSVFLQGVLLDFDKLSDYFLAWKNEFDAYQVKVIKNKLTLLEYAINFVISVKEVDRVVVGVNSKQQLKGIIESIKVHSNIEPFPINDINLLNPVLWEI